MAVVADSDILYDFAARLGGAFSPIDAALGIGSLIRHTEHVLHVSANMDDLITAIQKLEKKVEHVKDAVANAEKPVFWVRHKDEIDDFLQAAVEILDEAKVIVSRYNERPNCHGDYLSNVQERFSVSKRPSSLVDYLSLPWKSYGPSKQRNCLLELSGDLLATYDLRIEVMKKIDKLNKLIENGDSLLKRIQEERENGPLHIPPSTRALFANRCKISSVSGIRKKEFYLL